MQEATARPSEPPPLAETLNSALLSVSGSNFKKERRMALELFLREKPQGTEFKDLWSIFFAFAYNTFFVSYFSNQEKSQN